MKLILNYSTDPAFNLAAEEYLLNTAQEPLCMLWRNDRAVVVGKNQDTLAEIDQAYAQARGIRVHRRLTGGGAVYHDLGNVNFTLIEPEAQGHFNDYAHFTADLIAFLTALGVDARLNDRNDILVDNLKICGNAQCVMNGRVLHHGCILFDSNLTILSNVLKPKKGRGIASVASRVTNIRGYVQKSADEFLDAFVCYIKEKYNCAGYDFTAEEQLFIQKLADEKYNTREWNYGCSPDWSWKTSPE